MNFFLKQRNKAAALFYTTNTVNTQVMIKNVSIPALQQFIL